MAIPVLTSSATWAAPERGTACALSAPASPSLEKGRFKIDWPAPERIAKTQDVATCKLQDPVLATPPQSKFKIDWPAPQKTTETQDVAACKLSDPVQATPPQSRFKIDWPAPQRAANTHDVAGCTLPPPELVISPDIRFKNINKRDPLIRRMDDGERRHHFPQATEDTAKIRNRYPDVLPTPVDLVTLAHPTNPETSYINASKFHDMIITQGPLKNFHVDTVADFWMMAFEQAQDIVCLTDPTGLNRDRDVVEKTFPYWQSCDPSNPVVYKKQLGLSGELEVKLVENSSKACSSRQNPKERVTIRVFQISLNGQVKRVKHWLFENWQDNCVCDHMLLARFIDKLSIPADGNNSVVVHCSAGIGRSGVFVIAKYFIDRYRLTGLWPTVQEIDDAVLELRKRRPGSVQNTDQLDLIEKTICAYRKVGYVSQSA